MDEALLALNFVCIRINNHEMTIGHVYFFPSFSAC
jgi:hypothetical protein